MIVQIYEIQSPEEAEACISLGVDHIGSVLLSGTEWRDPLIREVVRLTGGTQASSSLIPLFREEDTVYRSLDYYRPHFIHLCESLTDSDGRPLDLGDLVSLQERLKSRFPEIRIIRTIPIPPENVAPDFPFLSLSAVLEHVSDLFLVDTWLGREPVEGYVGITGRTADWGRARDLVLCSRIPVILAGGLSPDNVYEALTRVAPHGADSCTHTNATDRQGRPIRFRKDLTKVERFVREIRRAEQTGKIDSRTYSLH
jgi:phosphoribosylanthranilate isomerase